MANLKTQINKQRLIAKAWLFVCLWLSVISVANAAPEAIAVLYPEFKNPAFERIFNDIISGIKDQSSAKIVPFAIAKDFDPDELNSWAKAIKINAVIAIGRSSISAAKTLDDKLPLIRGATFIAPDPEAPLAAGISMIIDPDVLFERLKSLTPGVKRVSVVYNPAQNDWLIELAKQSAKKHGLELIPYEAKSLKTAARLYRQIIDQSKPKEDAIWLPKDNITANSKAILPLLLKESWDQSLTVFSSTPSHAKKGTLFSIYPHNHEMGKSLAKIAMEHLKNSATRPQIVPLKDIQFAVNIRTADHLDIDINGKQFDLVFPAPRTAQ